MSNEMPKAKIEMTKLARSHFGLVALVILVVACLLPLSRVPQIRTAKCREVYRQDIKDVSLSQMSSEVFSLEVLRTEAEREKGLSGRECIPENTALLFTFDTPGDWGFWMKDMRFDIDIVWLDADKKITHIESNVLASSYPKIYYPHKQSLYALEMKAGRTGVLGLKSGDKLSW